MREYLIFTREAGKDDGEWAKDPDTYLRLGDAIGTALAIMDDITGDADAVAVMEVGGSDALPTFTLKHTAKKPR